MKVNVIEDVSTLTTIAQKDIVKFLKKFIYAICCGINESDLSEEDITEADIGIGTIYIKHDKSSDISYKFVPCKYLQKSIENTLKDGKSPFEDDLNSALVNKFTNVYKDLC